MKKIVLAVCFMTAFLLMNAQVDSIIHFPDANFKAALLNNVNIYGESQPIDTNADGEIQVSEAEAYTDFLTIMNNEIADLTGLSYFKNITGLYVSDNPISALDLSGNTKLTHVLAENCTLLTSINLLNCSQLYALSISGSSTDPSLQFEGLEVDLSGNPNLEHLFAMGANIRPIDFSHTPNIMLLLLAETPIETIDVSPLPLLQELWITGTYITSLDLSQNPNLIVLDAQGIIFDTLDLTHNSELKELILYGNGLSNIDLSQNQKLTMIVLTSNNLTGIDLSHNTQLQQLTIANNKLTTLDVSNLPNLYYLDVSDNTLEELNIANGSTMYFQFFLSEGNENLECVQVDEGFNINDAIQAGGNWYYDEGTNFMVNCGEGNVEITTLNEELLLFPNPTNGQLNINYTATDIDKITVTNLLGIKVFEDEKTNTISLANLPQGVYLVSVTANGQTQTSPVVKN